MVSEYDGTKKNKRRTKPHLELLIHMDLIFHSFKLQKEKNLCLDKTPNYCINNEKAPISNNKCVYYNKKIIFDRAPKH